jgi:NAD(P)-dependent dehydrogenase (short-subunit alcohol dehydrogenase family)
MGRLSGITAVVTGIGPGNGSAIARLFASEGADLALVSLPTPALAEVAAAVEGMGRRVSVLEGDVGLRETWDRARDIVKREFGGADVVVNNAATGRWVNLLDLSESEFDATLRTNLKSALFSFQTFIPGMVERGGGVFVNISSVNGLVANPNFVDYATSKSGLHGMTRNVALDFGRKGIRANCIAPGAIFNALAAARLDKEEARTIRDNYPLGRWGAPEDVAKAALFLACDESAFITGIVLPVDGGLTLHTPEAAVRKSFRALWRDDVITIHEAPK